MDSDDGIMGEELLQSPDDGIDKLMLRNLQHEVLHKALLSLEKDGFSENRCGVVNFCKNCLLRNFAFLDSLL